MSNLLNLPLFFLPWLLLKKIEDVEYFVGNSIAPLTVYGIECIWTSKFQYSAVWMMNPRIP